MPEPEVTPTEPKPGDKPAGVDLTDPAIQAAITAAVERANTAASEREAGLRKNRDDLLEEKTKFAELGSVSDLATKLAELETLKTEAAAGKVGANSEEFRAAVDAAAQEKYNLKAQELSDLMTAKETEIAALKDENAKLGVLSHRNFAAAELVKAALPPDSQFVQAGAWDYLIDQVAGIMVPVEVDGLGTVARFKVNEALVPGNAPDGLMDAAEFLPLARSGKGPIPSLGFCFTSAGKGSETVLPGGTPSSKSWWDMSEEERSAFTREKGSDASKDLIDKSGPRPAESVASAA